MIEIKNMSFKYNNDDKNYVIDNLNLEIKKRRVCCYFRT